MILLRPGQALNEAEDPWTDRTADTFWDKLHDEMMEQEATETEHFEEEAEDQPKPKKANF